MTTASRSLALALSALAIMAGAGSARAQGAALTVQAPKEPRAAIESGDVATIGFMVRNDSRDTLVAEPKVIMPAGWRIVMSPAATVIAPAESELWLISVKPPATAAAGSYGLRVSANGTLAASQGGPFSATAANSDSVVVTIAERRAVAVLALGAPAYVMAGDEYTGNFIIHNAGNVASNFRINARSNHGDAPELVASDIALAPGQTDTIRALVVIPKTIGSAVQEMLEIIAVDATNDTVKAEASMQTTVVPVASNGPLFWTIPGEVALRTSTPNSGVSAFTAWGSGHLTATSDVLVDFSVRGPTGRVSVFGENEEYRLGLRNTRGSVRVGDNSFGFSRLITGGGRSTGAEVVGNFGSYVGGVYVERSRFRPDAATEASVMFGTDRTRKLSGTLVGLTRSGANVMSSAARAMVGKTAVEVEMAASDSLNVGGTSGAVRVSGEARHFDYDLSAHKTSDFFASMRQGTSDAHMAISSRQIGSVFLTGSTNVQIADPASRADGVGQRLNASALTANFTNGTTVELERFDRADRGTIAAIRGSQNTTRVRSRLSAGMFDVALNIQGSIVAESDSAKSRGTVNFGSTTTMNFGDGHFVSLFADLGDGHGLGESGSLTTTTGINTEAVIAHNRLRLITSVSTYGGATAGWSSQTDLSVERQVRTSTVAVRTRISSSTGAPTNHALYLEVKNALRVPTAPLNTAGRARATVVDGETGRGVAGALIRLGGQAAVTDLNGVATFRNLKAGDHRAVVDGGAVAGRVVTSGALVSISGTSRAPTEFQLNLARGARVAVRLRKFEKSSSVIANGGDTLTEVGALGQVFVALISESDTVWQASDDRGRVDFSGVAPGTYKIALPRYETPDFMTLTNKEFTVEVGSGEQRQVEFKLVPQARAVEFVGETIIIAAPSAPKSAAPASSTITGKAVQSPVTAPPSQASPVTTPARFEKQTRQQQPQPQRQQQQKNQGSNNQR